MTGGTRARCPPSCASRSHRANGSSTCWKRCSDSPAAATSTPAGCPSRCNSRSPRRTLRRGRPSQAAGCRPARRARCARAHRPPPRLSRDVPVAVAHDPRPKPVSRPLSELNPARAATPARRIAAFTTRNTAHKRARAPAEVARRADARGSDLPARTRPRGPRLAPRRGEAHRFMARRRAPRLRRRNTDLYSDKEATMTIPKDKILDLLRDREKKRRSSNTSCPTRSIPSSTVTCSRSPASTRRS